LAVGGLVLALIAPASGEEPPRTETGPGPAGTVVEADPADESAARAAVEPVERPSSERTPVVVVPRRGPFRMRSLDSLSLLFVHPSMETARTVPAGSLELSSDLLYASQEALSEARGYYSLSDGETMRLELSARWGLTDDLELAVTLPFHRMSTGFLDDFIDDFHDVTGLGPVRESNGLFNDDYLLDGQQYGGLPQDSFDIADLPISLKYALFREDRDDPASLSVRAAIELPTGDEERGFGSGFVDGAVGIVGERTLGDVTIYASVDGVFQGNPDRFEDVGVEVEPASVVAGAAIEWRLCDWLVPVMQVDWAPRLLRDSGGRRLRRDRFSWTIGAHIVPCESFRLRLALNEDISVASVPDVTFLIGLTASH